LLEVLREDYPGELDAARASLIKRGPGWEKRLLRACKENKIDF